MHKYFFFFLLFLPISTLVYSQDMDQLSKDSKYKAIFIEVNKIMDNGDLDQLDAYMKADVIDHQMDPSAAETGLEGIKEMLKIFQHVFPDMKTTIHTMAVSGDTLFAFATFSGTTSEPFADMPANHELTYDYVDVVRFEDGMMAEHWGFSDMPK